VVLLAEFEDNGVPGLGGNGRGFKSKFTRASNNDPMNNTFGSSWGRSRGTRIRVVSRGPDLAAEGDGLSDRSDLRSSGDSVATIGSSGILGGRGGCGGRSSGRKAGTDGESGLLEISKGVGCTVQAAVNSKDHSLATVAGGSVACLTTVNPDRLSIIDRDRVCWEIISLVDWHRHEARVKSAILQSTGVGKRRPSSRVVLGVEVEDDLVTRLSTDGLGRVL